VETNLEPSLDGIAYRARNDDTPWRCLRFQARRHIHIVAINVITLDDDVAKVKPDPEHDGFVVGLVTIGLDHSSLEVYCRRERVYGASELDQAAIALQPDHSPAATCHCRRKPQVQMFEKSRDGAALITAHQPR
jgi:hypothetical protein